MEIIRTIIIIVFQIFFFTQTVLKIKVKYSMVRRPRRAISLDGIIVVPIIATDVDKRAAYQLLSIAVSYGEWHCHKGSSNTRPLLHTPYGLRDSSLGERHTWKKAMHEAFCNR